MKKKIKYILYDHQDLKVLINSNEEIEEIIALNASIYYESKKFFSKDIIKKNYITDESKKKIIEESDEIENHFNKEIDKILEIEDSSKFNICFTFYLLNKIIFSYWYSFPDNSNIGIIYKNKIIVTADKEKAIYYFFLNLYDKDLIVLDFLIKKLYPVFLFKLINTLTILLLKNKKIIWSTSPSKIINDIKKIDKNVVIICYLEAKKKNGILNFLFGIKQVFQIIFNKNLSLVYLFPIINNNIFHKNKFNFLKKINNKKLKYLNDLLINIFSEVLNNSEILSKYSANLIKNTKAKTFFGNHMRPICGTVLSDLFKKNNLNSVLISHGSHIIQNEYFSKYEAENMSLGLLFSPFATCLACQSPLAFEYTKFKNLNSNIAKILPMMWSGKKRFNKKKYLDKFVILHASTIKLLHLRPWAYEDSFEFLENLIKLIKVVDKIENTLLIIRLRNSTLFWNELSLDAVLSSLPQSDNVIIKTSGSCSFEEDIINSDFMISYSSTTIEEAIHCGIAVGLLGLSNRYRHIPHPKSDNKSRKIVYHLNHDELLRDLLKIKSNHYNSKLTEQELTDYVWNDEFLSKKKFIIDNLLN